MGVLLLGAIVSALLSGLILLIASHILRKLRRRRLGCIGSTAIGVLLFIVLLWPLTRWMATVTTTTHVNLDPRKGEALLEFVGLPSNTTTDFCYRQSWIGATILADFQMSEPNFLSWLKSQGWNPVKFELAPGSGFIEWPIDGDMLLSTSVYPVRGYSDYRTVNVERGYCYFFAKEDNPDNTIKIIYDLDSHRVYFEHTTY